MNITTYSNSTNILVPNNNNIVKQKNAIIFPNYLSLVIVGIVIIIFICIYIKYKKNNKLKKSNTDIIYLDDKIDQLVEQSISVLTNISSSSQEDISILSNV